MGGKYQHGYLRAVGRLEPSAGRNDQKLTRLEQEWFRILAPRSGEEMNDNLEDANVCARRIEDIEAKIIATSAKSLTGVAVKIRFLKQAFILGPTCNDEKICQSVLADIDGLTAAAPETRDASYAWLSSILSSRQEVPGA